MSLLRDFIATHDRVDADYIAQNAREQKKRDKRLAFWIGICALGLAPGVLVIDWFFGASCLRKSISAYVYEPAAGSFFIVVLSFVAAFLFRYRGENAWDGFLATAAGGLGFVVALVPTSLSDFCPAGGARIDLRPAITFEVNDDGLGLARTVLGDFGESQATLPLAAPGSHFDSLGWLHTGAAILLLLILFYFARFAFARVRPSDRDASGDLFFRKRVRNAIYMACSIGMVAAFTIIAIHFAGFLDRINGFPAVFIGEGVALFFFGVAWMVKGRFWFGWLDNG